MELEKELDALGKSYFDSEFFDVIYPAIEKRFNKVCWGVEWIGAACYYLGLSRGKRAERARKHKS